jgi:hypothetical protein
VEGLATIDADLAAFIFSAHTHDCGERRLCLAKVPARAPGQPPRDARNRPSRPRVTRFRPNVTLFRAYVTLFSLRVTLRVTPAT